MSIFGGQYGSFGGGYMTGTGGQAMAPAMQFGGGFIQAPSTPAPAVEVKAASVEVVYAMDPASIKPRDRSGRKPRYDRKSGNWPFEHAPQGGVHRQKRY